MSYGDDGQVREGVSRRTKLWSGHGNIPIFADSRCAFRRHSRGAPQARLLQCKRTGDSNCLAIPQ